MGAQASHLPLNHNSNNAVLRGGQTPQIHQLHHLPQPSTSFTKRLSIRRSKKRRKHERLEGGGGGGSGTPTSSSRPSTAVPSTAATVVDGGDIVNNQQQRHRRMDRLRRSLRDSFRRRKDQHGASDPARPHLWQTDEKMVREGSCSFHVKYLGCVQVYESRGMQVCEDAIKLLRAQRRRPLRSVLYVTGDGLRVVDDDTKDLLVDQTIEKVSFCAPDRSLERGFSYICRDGTTRRWMCHGFMAIRESGERLSHAVGCAFAICLERKQQRDKECGVTMSLDPSTSSFTRYGSFRQATITERLTDPQDCKPADPVPVKAVENPFAVERPHAPVGLFERQGSLRVSGKLSDASPFKRHASLRLSDLPSTLQRQQLQQQHAAQQLQYRPSTAAKTVAPIPEAPASVESEDCDNVTLLCQELSQGLGVLSSSSTGPATAGPPPIRPAVRADEWLSALPGNGSAVRTGSVDSAPPSSTATSCSGPGSWTLEEPLAPSPLPTAAASAGSLSWTAGTGTAVDPFGSEWSQIAERNNAATTATATGNPFLGSGHGDRSVKAFEVHM